MHVELIHSTLKHIHDINFNLDSALRHLKPEYIIITLHFSVIELNHMEAL